MNPSRPIGKIITFYSYKGGTGRSMAVANIAWILATAGHSVMVIDWDLEAPGLHRYFRPFLIDKELASSEGIIDYIIEFCDEAIKPLAEGETPKDNWYVPFADLTRYRLSINYENFPRGGKIDFVPAGQQGPTYATRVNSFNWQDFYQRLGGGPFIEATREWLRGQYDYILIDSRTGVSDTAGICTVQLPDTLAIFFTFNNQSITGAAAVAQSVFDQRKDRMEVPHRLRILPVPTRVDQTERDKLDERKVYARASFSEFLEAIREPDRPGYWDQVEIPYVPWFAYEEVLSPFRDSAADPKTVLASMKRITDFLVQPETESFEFAPLISPEEKQRVLAEFAATPTRPQTETEGSVAAETPLEKSIRTAERTFLSLTDEQRDEARRLWLRLVRVPRPGERTENSKLRILADDLNDLPAGVVDKFISAGLVVRSFDDTNNEPVVEVVNEDLLRNWKRLQEWIDKDRDFLLWRQTLQNRAAEWASGSNAAIGLLAGSQLKEASAWADSRRLDLSGTEHRYILTSRIEERVRRKRLTWVAAASAATIVILLVGFFAVGEYRKQKRRADQAKVVVRHAEKLVRDSAKLPAKQRADILQLAILLELEAEQLSSSAETQKLIMSHLSLLPRQVATSTLPRNVQEVALSEDGKRFVAILGRLDSEDKSAIVQETFSQKLLREVRFRAGTNQWALSVDGSFLAFPESRSGLLRSQGTENDVNQTMNVWDFNRSFELSVPVASVQGADIDRGNRYLALATLRGTRLVDLNLSFAKEMASVSSVGNDPTLYAWVLGENLITVSPAYEFA